MHHFRDSELQNGLQRSHLHKKHLGIVMYILIWLCDCAWYCLFLARLPRPTNYHYLPKLVALSCLLISCACEVPWCNTFFNTFLRFWTILEVKTKVWPHEAPSSFCPSAWRLLAPQIIRGIHGELKEDGQGNSMEQQGSHLCFTDFELTDVRIDVSNTFTQPCSIKESWLKTHTSSWYLLL